MNLRKKSKILIPLLILVCFMSVAFWHKPTLLSGKSFSTAIYDEKGQLLRLTLSQDDKYRLYTPLTNISPKLISATLLQEDQYFHRHPGINPFATIKAIYQTYILKSRRMGASTITMQVARLRFGLKTKTISGKLIQILRALQLELFYSKNQILEAYLNLAPYGNNIEGVGAASLIYFGKPIQKVNLPESLSLAVIPQNPLRRTPSQDYLKEVRSKLFDRWIKRHPEDRNQQSALNLPLQMENLHRLPFIAPHFVNSILNNKTINHEITTTLDSKMQKLLERITKNYINRKKNLGVYNAAVLLVDTRDMGIKASIGSSDFFNNKIQGQINGTEIKRSPGSTLKPFIYGLALDQGLIHPNTVLKDVPHSFGSYNPENFDYDFMGPVKAKEALILSRNIPAIYLGSQLNPNLYQLLEKIEIKNLKSESYYGLALILGGAEISMQELTSLYATLANDGIWQPLRFRQDQPLMKGKTLFSPEASFLVLDMLKETVRHDSIYFATKKMLPVAWKTGTSSGFRDAWTVGVVGPYVLTVWIGNFDNTSNPIFVGKSIAAPLFFEIIDGMQQQINPFPLLKKHPENLHLRQIPVCKASGMLPTRYCKDTELTWFIPGKSPIKTDTIFREVAIDKETGLRTCRYDNSTRFDVYEFWSSDLLKIFKQAGIQRRTPPSWDESCSLINIVGSSPQITSPKPQISYVVRANQEQKTKVPFTATTDADVSDLFWFINETFLAKTRRDQPFFWIARPGKYIVRVVDDHGRSDARDLEIKLDS